MRKVFRGMKSNTGYAELFKNRKGNVAKPLRLALGACIIQSEYGYSDEETALQIQEGPYLQFFCGFPKYEYKQPFDPSLMVYFRKRLTPEILGEINELIIRNAKKESEEEHPDDKDDSGKPQPPQNAGTMIVDATCAPSNIKYPQDTELLNEARENTEAMIDGMHDPKDGRRPALIGSSHTSEIHTQQEENRETDSQIGPTAAGISET